METYFNKETISNWDRFYRSHFINSLSGFKSASLIGTTDRNGHYNLALFSNIIHVGADPALVGFINRPRQAAPHTIANIEDTLVYTINLFTVPSIGAAHQSSAKYPAGVSEFDVTGLTPQLKPFCKAPFVKESPVKYALELQEIIPIRLNNTWLVIGAVTDVLLESELLEEDGFLSLEKAGVVTSLGIDAYYSTRKEKRLPYAKP